MWNQTISRSTTVLLSVAGVISAVLWTGCGALLQSAGELEPTQFRALKPTEKQLVTASNHFAFDLLEKLHQEKPAENLFISPLSASMALGMIFNGANTTTFDAMSQTLSLGELSQEQINDSYRSLIDLFAGLDPKATFQIANSIWYRQSFPFEQDFMSRCRQFFDAEIDGLNFDDPASVDVINGWVDAKTNQKIPEIIKKINPLDVDVPHQRHLLQRFLAARI